MIHTQVAGYIAKIYGYYKTPVTCMQAPCTGLPASQAKMTGMVKVGKTDKIYVHTGYAVFCIPVNVLREQ